MNHLSQILLGASRHASTDTSRVNLNAVRLSWSLGSWVACATDGHSLIVVSVKGDGVPFEATYDAKAVAKGSKLAKAKLGACELAEGNALAFTDGAGAVLRVEPNAVNFPPVAQVIPREVPAGGRAGFNATYIAAHCETHALFTSPKTNGVTIAPGSTHDPMTIVSESSEGFSCLSVIMPMRMWEANEVPGARIHAHVRSIVGAPIAALESEAAQ